MNNVSKEKVISDARENFERTIKSDAFLITTHTRTKNEKDERVYDMKHDVVRVEYPNSDIISSFNSTVKQLGVILEPAPVVVIPPEIKEKRRPLKIGIMSHFNRFASSYSPAQAFKRQITMLQDAGHEVVAFVMQGSTVELGCETRDVVVKFKRIKNVVSDGAKTEMADVLRREIDSSFDIMITHDLFLDDCITYRKAIEECGVAVKWLHFARSGLSHQLDKFGEDARYVYLNYADTAHFARNLGVEQKDVRTIFNDKEPSIFFNWDKITTMIASKMKLWDKDVVQVYPICTSRMSAKQIKEVLRVFSTLKRLGKSVGLVIANSNGRRRVEQINEEIQFAKELGLVHGEDFVFTSLLATDEFDTLSEVSQSVVSELFQISNLFVFPTCAEVGSNILLEASLGKNLLVLNADLPNLFDFTKDGNTLSFPFTSGKSLHYHGKTQEVYEKLAKEIIGQLNSNKADKQFRHVWRNHNFKSIYKNMYEPVLYEGLVDTIIKEKDEK